MVDVHEPEVRSYNMSQIKGKDTKPEMVVRRFLHSNGYRYRLHGKYKGKKLIGKPDIVLAKFKTAIFVQGCFWHGHYGCRNFKLPKTNRVWWQNKIENNKERDTYNQQCLKAEGWTIIIIWECEVRGNSFINKLQMLY